MNANIEKALAAANDTRALWIGAGVSDRVADLFKEQFPAMPAVIVADTTTWQVLGEKVSRLFFFVYVIRYVVLDWGPTLLSEWKGVSIEHAGWMVAAGYSAHVACLTAPYGCRILYLRSAGSGRYCSG